MTWWRGVAGILSTEVAVTLFVAAPAALAGPPELSLPIDCQPNITCFLQSYVDIDPGPGVSDFACGRATYDGHKGTDFRLLSEAVVKDHIRVLAAAPGVLKGMRDGMPDKIARDIGSKADIKSFLKGRDCGNGVVIDHGDGWETQYCHMRRGSVRLKTGAKVERGTHIGDVGFSGRADFAHIHLSVRHNGKVIDPFTGDGLTASCRRTERTAGALWRDEVLKQFPYLGSQIMIVGFAGQAVQHARLVRDHRISAPNSNSKAMVAFARIINLRAGDRVRVRGMGPDGFAVDQITEPLERGKADFSVFAGKKLRKARWAAGTYRGTVEVLRNGQVFASKTRSIVLD